MDDSHVTIGPKGSASFVGHDAVKLFRTMTLRNALSMYQKTKMKPNRAWTPTAMLNLAGHICGKTYKRGQYQAAIDDLTVWIETMRSALPITRID